MRLSTRGRFAITAMIDLAMRSDAHPTPLVELAQRHGISLSYLEQVFAKLRQNGLVQSTRGPGGGYTLGFRGAEVTVADIVLAIEEDDVLALGNGQAGQSELAQDMTRSLWASLHTAVMAHMQTITLKSLADEQRARGVQVPVRKTRKKGVLQKPVALVLRPMVPNSVFALGQALMAKA
jgi:Rrf2 family iron-sulfur cluster assembly transcriptional regulator